MADVAAVYGCASAAPHGLNGSRYCNPAVDAEMQAYDAAYEPRRRAELARRFQREIDADVPPIVMYERNLVYAFNTGLTGFVPTAFGTFDDFLNVDIQL